MSSAPLGKGTDSHRVNLVVDDHLVARNQLTSNKIATNQIVTADLETDELRANTLTAWSVLTDDLTVFRINLERLLRTLRC